MGARPGPGLPSGVTQTKTTTDPRSKTRDESERPTPWNVVLLDDQDHSYDYVIRMVVRLFGVSAERAVAIAKEVDEQGRAVCLTTHKERAEFKRDQIHAFGTDPIIAMCHGSMSSIIEPAEFGGDDPEDGGRTDG